MSRALRVLAACGGSLALQGCGGFDEIFASSEGAPPLFQCDGKDSSYLLHSIGGGAVSLEIVGEARDGVGVSTWIIDWDDQRVGHVVGQQGGYQRHLRLERGGRGHFIFFEGEDGQLADRPGRTYAGVAYFEGDRLSEPVMLAECAADETNRQMVDAVQDMRADAELPALPHEDDDSPFNVWF